MAFNCYQDATRANAYSQLEFANTYYLAYRDLPEIVREHVTGTKAIDFGRCERQSSARCGQAIKKPETVRLELNYRKVVFHAALALGRLLISTRRGKTAAATGAVISSKPLLNSALIFSASTPSGNISERLNVP